MFIFKWKRDIGSIALYCAVLYCRLLYCIAMYLFWFLVFVSSDLLARCLYRNSALLLISANFECISRRNGMVNRKKAPRSHRDAPVDW